jgi:hypothetical protein
LNKSNISGGDNKSTDYIYIFSSGKGNKITHNMHIRIHKAALDPVLYAERPQGKGRASLEH